VKGSTRVRALAVATITVLLVPLGGMASASGPTSTPVPFQETFTGVEDVCDFPLTVAFNMQQTERTWTDADGNVTKTHVTGRGSTTLSNEWTGKSVRVNTSGPMIGNKGVGAWLFIVTKADAPYVPVPTGAWLYKGHVSDLGSDNYPSVFRGRIVDMCAVLG